MNRRWTVALVIVMLATIAPSAALGAAPPKVTDKILSIQWTAAPSTVGSGQCQSMATVTYTVAKGPERYIEAAVVLDSATGLGSYTSGVYAARGGGTEIIGPMAYPMGTTQYKLGVQISSRKGVVFAPVFTGPWMGCGQPGDTLGSYTAP